MLQTMSENYENPYWCGGVSSYSCLTPETSCTHTHTKHWKSHFTYIEPTVVEILISVPVSINTILYKYLGIFTIILCRSHMFFMCSVEINNNTQIICFIPKLVQWGFSKLFVHISIFSSSKTIVLFVTHHIKTYQ